MSTVLAVAVGGAVGAVLRYGLSSGLYAWLGTGFPVGTLAVNVIGALAMGVIVEGSATAFKLAHEVRALLVVGVLGAFTTFSTFALDAAVLFDRQAIMLGLLYIVLSVVLCIGGFYLGVSSVRLILS